MVRQLPSPTELLGRIADATFSSVGLEFLMGAAKVMSESWGMAALFVSEADPGNPDAGRVMVFPAKGDSPVRSNRWVRAGGLPWFPCASETLYCSSPVDIDDDHILRSLHAKSVLVLRLLGRDVLEPQFIGFIGRDVWVEQEAAEVQAMLRLIGARTAAELERERLVRDGVLRERALRHVADSLADGVLIWSGDSRATIDYVNEAALDLIGEPDEHVPLEANGLLGRIAALPRSGGAGDTWYEGPIAVTRRDGTTVNLIARTALVTTPGREPTYYCALRPAGAAERDLLTGVEHVSSALMEEGSGMLVFKTDGALTLVSAKAGEMLGSNDPAEILAKRIVVRTAGDEVSMTVFSCARQLARHRSSHRLVRVVGRRGERLLKFSSNLILVHDAQRVVVRLTDVTERERQLSELQRQGDLMRSVLASVPAGLIAIDGEGKVLWSSEDWGQDEDPPVDELRWVVDLKAGDDFIAACHQAALAGGQLARDFSVGVARVMTGSSPWYNTQVDFAVEGADRARTAVTFVAPLAQSQGVLIGVADMTFFAEHAHAVESDADWLRSLLAGLPYQVGRVAPNGDLVEVFGPAERAPGVALLPSGAFKRNVREVLPAEEAATLLHAAHEAVERNQPVVATLSVIRQGAERQYEARLMPRDDGVLLTLVDRTTDRHAASGPAAGEATPRLRLRNPYDLTFREASVLELMAEGASDKEIAKALGVSVFTVNKHVSKVLHKMGAASRTEASLRAVRESLVGR